MGEDCNKKSRNLTKDWSGHAGRSFWHFWEFMGFSDDDFPKNEILTKNEHNNTTTQHFNVSSMKDNIVLNVNKLIFTYLLLFQFGVVFFIPCCIYVVFVLCFTPICCVLIVNSS